MNFFIDGLLLGFAYVAPIGMQNLFMINTALTQPKMRTYLTAFIIMFFDITLAVACFYGIGAIMSASFWLEFVVLGIGSLIVLWIGFSIFRSEGSMMMLGAFRASIPPNQGLIFIAGVSLASALWWLFIATLGGLFSDKFNNRVLRIINIVCGAVIMFYGAKLFWSFVQLAKTLF